MCFFLDDTDQRINTVTLVLKKYYVFIYSFTATDLHKSQLWVASPVTFPNAAQ